MNTGRIIPFWNWLREGSDLLFPPLCPVCSVSFLDSDHGLCVVCRHDVALIRSPLCLICGREMGDSATGDHTCGTCLRKAPFYNSARGVVHYQEPVANLLHRLKYQGEYSVLPALKEIIMMWNPIALQGEDRIIPVPLHIKRLRHRGFNQALLLARLFFPDSNNLILMDALLRTRHTDPQTGLNGIERRKNMSNAFMVRDPGRIQGRKIFLVDDVYTTGTTVSECSRVLLAAGAREVHVVTLARVKE